MTRRAAFVLGYRVTSASADSNSGLYYAKSADKGRTFTNATGDISYAVPLHSGNSERPVVVSRGSGYVNQNGACVDLSGNYHTVYWQQDENGYTRLLTCGLTAQCGKPKRYRISPIRK
ncbi:hypothetical protein DMH27_27400 [Raoultella planticola]|nr:hypothetical protein [Raoultella planticola]